LPVDAFVEFDFVVEAGDGGGDGFLLVNWGAM